MFWQHASMVQSVKILGIEMRPGDSVTVASREAFRDWLMPVLVIDDDGKLKVNGTAVCVGNGTFVTARHVVDYLLDDRRENEDAGVWVAWDTGEVAGSADELRGHMMSVVRYRRHEQVDLAILTTKVPSLAIGRHRTVPWALRMPALRELVALLGYPNGEANADLTLDGPINIKLTHPLTISLGCVTEYFKEWASEPIDPWGERRPLNPRGWPGFGTDAPMPPAMSGGAVFDQRNRLVGFCSSSDEPRADHEGWAGFVNMAGYLLDMDVDVNGPDGALVPTTVPDVLDAGQWQVVTDPATFHLGENDKATYVFPPAR